jgi:pilus assembly protein CpaB
MKLSRASIPKIKKTWAVLGVALAIGLLGALAARAFLNTQVAAIEARGKHVTAPVLVALTELKRGSVLTSQNLARRDVPVEFAHSGAAKVDELPRIEGKTLAFDVKAGELILWSQMEGVRVPTFSARLEPGQRAITVVVDEISSISGLLEPGDLIDLMFALDQNGRKMIFPLLQSVQVMATGQRSVDDAKTGERVQFATVTLNATPTEAKNILLARETGKITALLRNPTDQEPIGNKSVDLAALFSEKRVAPLRPRFSGVPVLYGGSKFAPEAFTLGRSRATAESERVAPSTQLTAAAQ